MNNDQSNIEEISHKNGSKYKGKFKDNKFHGQDILYYKNNSKILYKGEFKDNKFHGQGILYYKNSWKILYKGKFEDGKLHGQGILYLKSGEKYYKGKFSRGKLHGKGTLYSENGKEWYKGKFEDGERCGLGTYYFEDGEILKGNFKLNEFNDNEAPLSRRNRRKKLALFFRTHPIVTAIEFIFLFLWMAFAIIYPLSVYQIISFSGLTAKITFFTSAVVSTGGIIFAGFAVLTLLTVLLASIYLAYQSGYLDRNAKIKIYALLVFSIVALAGLVVFASVGASVGLSVAIGLISKVVFPAVVLSLAAIATGWIIFAVTKKNSFVNLIVRFKNEEEKIVTGTIGYTLYTSKEALKQIAHSYLEEKPYPYGIEELSLGDKCRITPNVTHIDGDDGISNVTVDFTAS